MQFEDKYYEDFKKKKKKKMILKFIQKYYQSRDFYEKNNVRG